MNIRFGEGQTEYGPGVRIDLDGNEVATAIDAFLVAHGISIFGPRTITVNGKLCEGGNVYVDPSGFVITADGRRISGGPSKDRSANYAAETTTNTKYYCYMPDDRKVAARDSLRHLTAEYSKYRTDDGKADVILEQIWNHLVKNF